MNSKSKNQPAPGTRLACSGGRVGQALRVRTEKVEDNQQRELPRPPGASSVRGMDNIGGLGGQSPLRGCCAAMLHALIITPSPWSRVLLSVIRTSAACSTGRTSTPPPTAPLASAHGDAALVTRQATWRALAFAEPAAMAGCELEQPVDVLDDDLPGGGDQVDQLPKRPITSATCCV